MAIKTNFQDRYRDKSSNMYDAPGITAKPFEPSSHPCYDLQRLTSLSPLGRERKCSRELGSLNEVSP